MFLIFYIKNIEPNDSHMKSFIFISVKRKQRKSKFRYDSAKLRSVLINSMLD